MFVFKFVEKVIQMQDGKKFVLEIFYNYSFFNSIVFDSEELVDIFVCDFVKSSQKDVHL